MGHQLSHTGPQHNSDKDLTGVYKVTCIVCSGVYYGETGRTLSMRICDHKNNIRDKLKDSALYMHIHDNPGHSFDFDSAELLYKSNHRTKRQLVESSLIATHDNINIKAGDFPVCRLTAPSVLQASIKKSVSSSAQTFNDHVAADSSTSNSPDSHAQSSVSPVSTPACTTTNSQPSPQSPASNPSPQPSVPLHLSSHVPDTPPSIVDPVPTLQPPANPPVSLQSQARALPFTTSHPTISAVTPSPPESPVSGRTHRKTS